MATARKHLIDPEARLFYHLISRCVRRSFLCGKDKRTGKDYGHRKQWIIDGINHLTPCFALNILSYAIMSNHFHLVVDYDPTANKDWTDQEVADRWVTACPKKKAGKIDEVATALYRESLLLNPQELKRVRAELGSLSTFMKLLKWSIAYRANKEDGCTGHFFEQRFWSGAILDEPALIASMAYVDLNPVRAKITDSIKNSENTSIFERTQVTPLTPERLAQAMVPIVAGLEVGPDSTPALSLGAYIEHLNVIIKSESNPSDIEQRWIQQVSSIGKRQRAYGAQEPLQKWLAQRQLRPLEKPLSV